MNNFPRVTAILDRIPDAATTQKLGACHKCGSRVEVFGNSYICHVCPMQTQTAGGPISTRIEGDDVYICGQLQPKKGIIHD